MPVIDARALRVVWTVFLFALAVALVYLIRQTLIVFVLALFFAQLLTPVVDLLERFVRKKASRTVALIVVYLALLGGAVAILVPIGSKIGEEATSLAAKLPQAIQSDPLSSLPLPWWLEEVRPKLTEMLRNQMVDLDQKVLPILSGAGKQILSGLGSLVGVFLIPILSFFFLKDGNALYEIFVGCFNGRTKTLMAGVLSDMHDLLAHYTRALLTLALATFLSHAAFLWIIGVPYFVLLAAVAAVLEFIPVVGPFVSALVMLLVAGFTGYPHLLWIVAFAILYRLFQDYVLSPYLMSRGIELHPLLVLFGVLAGEQVAGIPGMFFAVPVLAAMRLIFRRLRGEPVDAA